LPTLERIRQFEKALVKLGAEPEILAERGEEIEEVAPPEEGIAADLHDLLTPPTGGAAAGPPAEEPAAEAPADEEPLDTLDLGAFGLEDEAAAEAPAEPAAPPAAEEGGDVGFDLPTEFFETGAAETATEGTAEAGTDEGFELPGGDLSPAEPEAGALDESLEAPQEPAVEPGADFELPADLDAETGTDFELPQEPGAEAGESFELPEEPLAEAGGDFELPAETGSEAGGDFELPREPGAEASTDFELPGEPAAEGGEDLGLPEGFELPEAGEEAEPGKGPAAEEPAEDFELPEGLFEDMEAGEPIETAPEAEGEEIAADQQPAAAARAGAESFDLPDLGAESAPDAAEEISFDEGAGEEPAGQADAAAQFELPDEEPAAGAAASAAEAGADEDFVLDQFALPGVDEAEEPSPAAPFAGPAAAPRGPAAGPGQAAEAYEGEGPRAEYTDDEFERIREALASLPLALRIAVEEAIGSRQVQGDAVRRLIDLLIDGGSAAEIARALSQATGAKVSAPRGVEKGTGIAFERERGSVGYLLRKSVLPALRVLVPLAGLLVGLWLATNETIFKPLQARREYNAAIAAIGQGQFAAAARSFEAATRTHAILKLMLETATAYRNAARFDSAGDIYERLIGNRTLLGRASNEVSSADQAWDRNTRKQMGLKPLDRRAVLPYAEMRTYETAEYPQAEALLKKYLADTANLGDYQALLALGDNYLEWASLEERRYDEAASTYRRAIKEQNPVNDEPILRMLRYYARTGKVEDVETIVLGFESKKKPAIDAQIYAEAAGLLIDARKYDLAHKALGRAYDTDPKVPETAFQYSRLFRWQDDAANEERALLMAIDQLTARKKLTTRQVRQEILARNALGELYNRKGEPLKAQARYDEAIKSLESALASRRVKPAPDLGRVYANSADVHYYNDRDLDAALKLYEKARGLGLADDDVAYKVGYIQYEKKEYARALDELHRVVQHKPDNPAALYSLANTLYLRGDYLAAQGYYNILIRQLEARRARIALLQPRENAQHRDLLELTMRTFNNLGVTEKKVSQDSRTGGRENRANFYLQRSIEFYDQLTRNPDSLVRTESRNLGFINSRTLMYPRAGTELEIYRELPKDLETTRLL
jgi:tetratricopeptide (TPR) repeat protein